MQIGYARSSTVDQEAGFQAQIKSLQSGGCEKVFAEQVSYKYCIFKLKKKKKFSL